jgi:hypothetical protein
MVAILYKPFGLLSPGQTTKTETFINVGHHSSNMGRKINSSVQIYNDNYVEEICFMIRESAKTMNIQSISIDSYDMMLNITGEIINNDES